MSAWTLFDPALSETWVMPHNPDAMSSPHPRRTLTHAYGTRAGFQRPRSFMPPPQATLWEWSGVIRSQAHYDAYVEWVKKPGEVHVTDHLGRTWEVLLEAFEPADRKPTANVPWRLRYTIKALVLSRVS